MITKHEWWITPVWEIQTEFDSKFNDLLIADVLSIKPSFNPKGFNIFDHSTERIEILKEYITKKAIECTSGLFNDKFMFNPFIERGWVNVQNPKNGMPLHDHGSTVLAATYYIKTPDNCGDLLLVDPRGAHDWGREYDNGIDCVKYKRITPSAGKLVMFPAYIMHMIEPNCSDEQRVSLSCNIINN